MKANVNVNDFYSITANHFINDRKFVYLDLHYIMAALIKNVNLAGLEEFNSVWACILFKGQNNLNLPIYREGSLLLCW